MSISNTRLREQAAVLLSTPSALADLTVADARQITQYMKPARIAAGTAFIHQGEVANNDFLALIIEGEATIELDIERPNDTDDDLVLTVIGPGGVVGTMGALDGDPRSASAIASTDMVVGLVSRDALRTMMEDDPGLAARFLLALSKRLFDRLRDVTRQIRSFTQVNRALMEQLDDALPDHVDPLSPTLALPGSGKEGSQE